ncbi:MAG: amylo-alpha-1,6-glucosidase [Planctomycetota bacterium]|nr:amylo-alpha-1,6-glucosidase [Planctomycetota bacterium]
MADPRVAINPDDPAPALTTEWLLTDGLGGFAMGTALGANTRRYHGLLIAATNPPLGRIVALHSVIEQLVIAGETIDLSTQQFGEEGTLHPQGWRHLTEFTQGWSGPGSLSGTECVWTYDAGLLHVERRFRLLPRSAHLTYRFAGLDSPALLRVRPLTPLRDFHALLSEGDGPCEIAEGDQWSVALARGDCVLNLTMPHGTWRREPQWWRNFIYAEDRARGQDCLEDVWSPGVFELDLQPRDGGAHCLFSAHASQAPGGAVLTGAERTTRLLAESPMARLRWAAEQFIVRRSVSKAGYTSVIAGYPWFGDWGRDTMIALPGLLLCTEHFDEAKQALFMFARHLQRGLIPNVFDDYGHGAAYNTVDASLWFVHAVREYLRASRDEHENVAELIDACRAILLAYRNGTDFDIHLDEDGLIAAGDEESQLTWMDAKRGGVVFTPRHGKPVEINALWHNALLSFSELTTDEREQEELRAAAKRTARAIRDRFWWEEKNCLHDVLHRTDEGWTPDGTLRPNQIFAVSLPHSPLSRTRQRAVVRAIRDRLLTPFGLRTLDPADPDYRGRFEGDLMQRDAAYHNGTVWPWLIGPYCEAILRAGEFGDKAKNEVRQVLQPLIEEIDRGCLNQIAEVYDGDEPQRAAGCPAQAWSVAEVLRVMMMTES